MFLFFLGAILGCSLGVVFLALLMKSKEIDESACLWPSAWNQKK